MRGLEARLLEIEVGIARLSGSGATPVEHGHDAALIAEWRRLMAVPSPPPRPLPPEIARLSDQKAVDLCRRLCRGEMVDL
jgi:hypothetical protein